jgi:uncharacterized protein with von Willebrand factor type A (vWA) domain
MSDGYDADPPEQLAEALARVRGRGARIDWFHPGAKAPGSTALRAALARGDLIQQVHRLDSLADLARLVEGLS